MKKLFAFLCVIGMVFCLAAPAAAGGIDNKTNWSAEYIRTFNRNAATDYADIAAYNPAGTVKMADGLYFNVSAQFLAKDYSNTYLGTKYEQDEPSIIPGVFAVYSKDSWAWYAAITNTGGGGAIDYKQGTKSSIQQAALIAAGLPFAFVPPGWSITSTSAKGESFYISYTLGGAYEINNMFSVSLGARFINASKEQEVNASFIHTGLGGATASVKADYQEDADGWGGIIGLNISPNDDLNIGIRYETKTELDFKMKIKRDDTGTLVQGSKSTRDLPALLGIGVSYRFFKNFRAETNFTYYLNESTDWDGDEESVDNGFDLGLALEYTVNPQWKFSVGYLYTDVGVPVDDMNPEVPELNANTIGGGFAYSPTPKLDLNFGVGNTFYTKETQSDGTDLEKNVFFMSFGIQYKFF
ncbi:MAG: outer membrane protein transport protein [Thermodesulfobacteriota bacterium]